MQCVCVCVCVCVFTVHWRLTVQISVVFSSVIGPPASPRSLCTLQTSWECSDLTGPSDARSRFSLAKWLTSCPVTFWPLNCACQPLLGRKQDLPWVAWIVIYSIRFMQAYVYLFIYFLKCQTSLVTYTGLLPSYNPFKPRPFLKRLVKSKFTFTKIVNL